MTRLSIFYFLSIVVLSSCASSNKFMSDDIYVLKPNAMPLGESSADETSYVAFKQRQEGRNVSKQVYANQFDQNRITQCYRQPFWTRDCGCSYAQWMYGSPYSSMNQPAFGMYQPYSSWGHPSYVMSAGNGFQMYSGYSNYYNPYYGYSSWNYPYMYGNYYNGYGWGGNSNGWNGNSNNSWNNNGYQYQANHHSGPRGSSSGFVNPNGRNYGGTLKSKTINSPNSTNNKGTVVSTNGRVESKPIETIPVSRSVERQTVQAGNRGSSSSTERTYTSPSQVDRQVSTPVSRTNSTESTGRSNGSGTVTSPTRVSSERGNSGRVTTTPSSPSKGSGGSTGTVTRSSSSPGKATPSRRP